MKYDITEIKVAQIHSSQINRYLLTLLRAYADYKDTDKTLNEVLVRVHSLFIIIKSSSLNINKQEIAEDLYEQVKDFDYIQITNI